VIIYWRAETYRAEKRCSRHEFAKDFLPGDRIANSIGHLVLIQLVCSSSWLSGTTVTVGRSRDVMVIGLVGGVWGWCCRQVWSGVMS
jgi:hypothetical protein